MITISEMLNQNRNRLKSEVIVATSARMCTMAKRCRRILYARLANMGQQIL